MYRLCMHTRSLPVRAASGQSLFRKSRDWRHFRWKGPHYFWLHMCRTYFRDFRSGQLPVTWLTSLPVMHNGPIPIDPPQIRLELFPYTTHVYVVIHFCDHMWSFKCAVLFFLFMYVKDLDLKHHFLMINELRRVLIVCWPSLFKLFFITSEQCMVL
jgi:hypothetical protein